MSDDIYFDGIPVGKMDNMCLETTDTIIMSNGNKITTLAHKEGKASITFNIVLTRIEMLSILYGRKITNNWLKLHCGVMSRKYPRRRRIK